MYLPRLVVLNTLLSLLQLSHGFISIQRKCVTIRRTQPHSQSLHFSRFVSRDKLGDTHHAAYATTGITTSLQSSGSNGEDGNGTENPLDTDETTTGTGIQQVLRNAISKLMDVIDIFTSYIIQFFGAVVTFGLLLNLCGYGYTTDFRKGGKGIVIDKLQNIRTEMQFRREFRETRVVKTPTDTKLNQP